MTKNKILKEKQCKSINIQILFSYSNVSLKTSTTKSYKRHFKASLLLTEETNTTQPETGA